MKKTVVRIVDAPLLDGHVELMSDEGWELVQVFQEPRTEVYNTVEWAGKERVIMAYRLFWKREA